MREKHSTGWTPEAELRPVRMATLLLLAVASFALAVLCFRLVGGLTGGGAVLLWAGLCFCPPLGVVLWLRDEQQRQGRTTAPVTPKTKVAGQEVDDSSRADLAEARLKINRDVA